MRIRLLLPVICFSLLACAGCKSSVEDALDLADGVERKPIDRSILGVNAFASDGRFGTPAQQFLEVRDTLGIRYVRLFFAWTDAVQSSRSAAPNFGFYDAVIDSLPSGVDALIVLQGAPSWVSNPANQIDGNPRTTFVREWVRAVARRYRNNSKIIGYQIWNEPNTTLFPENAVMGVVSDAANYVEMLALAHSTIKEISPSKLVLNGSTTAINQNFPDSLDYNRAMRDAGALSFVDRWAIHYYGKQFENVVRDGGVEDFLDGLNIGVWVTESGAQGVNEQLAYGEQAWPYLQEQIGSIERIYQYQFAEASPAASSYGMRTLDPAFPVSDLYVHLRDSAS